MQLSCSSEEVCCTASPQHQFFLDGIGHLVAKLDTQFQSQLCVPADISGHLNKLNLLSHGPKKLLCDLCEAVNGFIGKSSLFKGVETF